MVKKVAKKKVSTAKTKSVNIAIVAGKFNDFISKRLLNSCLIELKRLGVSDNHVTTVWVPGSFEIPLAAQVLAKKKTIDGVICLGAVIRGETYHFETVANECARGILQAGLSTGKPVIMGVLTCETVDQAYKRSHEKGGDNKGRDCAEAVIEMINLVRNLK